MRWENKNNGWDGQRVHLSRWVQAYGKQPAWMHMSFTLGNMVNNQVLGGGNVRMVPQVGMTGCGDNEHAEGYPCGRI